MPDSEQLAALTDLLGLWEFDPQRLYVICVASPQAQQEWLAALDRFATQQHVTLPPIIVTIGPPPAIISGETPADLEAQVATFLAEARQRFHA